MLGQDFHRIEKRHRHYELPVFILDLDISRQIDLAML